MGVGGRLAGALLLAASLLPGCSLVSGHTPPDGAWFDATARPTGGIPATLGYYGGVALLTPLEFVLGALLPAPVDGPVSRAPGEVVGTGVGLVVGAPFHLLSLRFGEGAGEEPREEPAAEER